jgi:ATP phosphoribosyltransferase regulatory subunit
MNALFELAGGDLVDPKIVIPASVPLELSGEAVRGRICTFQDEAGKEWALRPDLTLPVALDEIEGRRSGQVSGETTRQYRAPVFRLPAVVGEPVEFVQVGFEVFAGGSSPEQDASVLARVIAASENAGATSGHICFGDLGLFPAFVDAFELPDEASAGLKRAFRQEGGVRAYLAGQSADTSSLTNRLKGMSRDEAASFVDDIFKLTGIRPVGERSSDEIVERMFERANGGAADIPTAVKTILDRVLNVDGLVDEALAKIATIAAEAGLTAVNAKIERLTQRHDLISRKCDAAWLQGARFATRFGRRFTYYDGFVFEIAQSADASHAAIPFAAGGRYDALLSNLSGGDVDETAIGGVVIPHRLNAENGDVA